MTAKKSKIIYWELFFLSCHSLLDAIHQLKEKKIRNKKFFCTQKAEKNCLVKYS